MILIKKIMIKGDDHDDDEDDEEDNGQPIEDEQPEEEFEEGSDIDEDNEQLWGVCCQGLRAGKKLKSASKGWKKPTGRGRGGHGWPSSSSSSNIANVKKEKTGKCLDCGQFGFWKGDPECARVKSGQTPRFKKHGANVIYYSLTDDYDHDEEQTTVTLLYPDDPDEVMDWTPGEEVIEWNPNPAIVNPPWIPYVVDWQPPPPAKSPPRIVDLDELENGTSDFIDFNIQDDDEDTHIQYTEISAGQLDHVHKIDEHPLTTSQVETMRCTIDEKTSPETNPRPEDDDDDPWKNIEEEIHNRHPIKNDKTEMFCSLCKSTDHLMHTCPDYRPGHPICQHCKRWNHEALDCEDAIFEIYNYLCNVSADSSTCLKKAMTWDEWYMECDSLPTHQTFVTIRKETESEPEPEVRVKKIKLRITSDLNPPLSHSDDEPNDDPPYQGVPPERPAAPPPRCDVPPPPKVSPREMWFKIKELYDKHLQQERRNQMGQYELRDLMERCGYSDRFREASFFFQYYRFGNFYDEIFMEQPTAPV